VYSHSDLIQVWPGLKSFRASAPFVAVVQSANLAPHALVTSPVPVSAEAPWRLLQRKCGLVW